MRLEDVNKTYVISLPKSDRLTDTMGILWSCAIEPEIWNATRMENGADGLKATFKAIFENALKKGFSTCLIFEDDIKVANMSIGINAYMRRAVDYLPQDFHILKFGANLLTPVIKYNDTISGIHLSYALHACLYLSLIHI